MTFFNLKELEKLAPSKGLHGMQVKEILTCLCDDSKVSSEKIGSGMFFWSFPGAALRDMRRKKEENDKKIEDLHQQESELKEKFEIAKKLNNSEERARSVLAEEKVKVEKEQAAAQTYLTELQQRDGSLVCTLYIPLMVVHNYRHDMQLASILTGRSCALTQIIVNFCTSSCGKK